MALMVVLNLIETGTSPVVVLTAFFVIVAAAVFVLVVSLVYVTVCALVLVLAVVVALVVVVLVVLVIVVMIVFVLVIVVGVTKTTGMTVEEDEADEEEVKVVLRVSKPGR
jgi:hypothetical protein